jgi:hypothetical protein
LAVPVDAITTAAPGITLLNASRAVTVMVEAVVPATQETAHAVMLEVPAATVEVAALTAAGFTTTPAVCVIPVPAAVAEIVFASATVDDRRPRLYTPAPSVVPVAFVTVLPVPVAAHVTLTLGIGLLNWSRTVTVIVDWLAPLLAVIGLVAASDDWLADGAPGVAEAVNVTGLPDNVPEVAVSVLLFEPATVPSVQPICAKPEMSVVTGLVPVSEPPPPVTAKVTDVPVTALLKASRTMTRGGVATAALTGAD